MLNATVVTTSLSTFGLFFAKMKGQLCCEQEKCFSYLLFIFIS